MFYADKTRLCRAKAGAPQKTEQQIHVEVLYVYATQRLKALVALEAWGGTITPCSG